MESQCFFFFLATLGICAAMLGSALYGLAKACLRGDNNNRRDEEFSILMLGKWSKPTNRSVNIHRGGWMVGITATIASWLKLGVSRVQGDCSNRSTTQCSQPTSVHSKHTGCSHQKKSYGALKFAEYGDGYKAYASVNAVVKERLGKF